MFKEILNSFSRFLKDQKGVTLVEYGIALFLAITVGAATLTLLGSSVKDKMSTATSVLQDY